MTWISLICLLALTSSALGRSAYGNGYGSAQQLLASQRSSLPMMTVAAQGYGQQLQQPLVNQWASAVLQQQKQQQDAAIQQLQGQYSNLLSAAASAPKTLPAQSYGQVNQGYAAMPVAQQFDQQQQQPQPIVPILTEADMLCRGQQAETIIPLDGGRKFIVCLDESKGVEQQCPQGLYYHSESHRCERKLGPLENACATQPCLNGGQCLSYGSSYQCQCAAGFEGETCELDARICQTQQPCGQSPDTKCQSFRLGAALQYICVFQGGLAYGLNAQQVVPSPCQGVDGPQALAVSNNGFIMCDGERLSIESCPGGTIWDDVEKACSWPDMQTAPQLDQQQSYGQSSYGEQQKMTAKSTYGNQWSAPQQTQSYSNQWSAPQQIQSYGAQINIPQQAQMIAPKKIHSHRGHHHMPKHFDQQQQVQSYGAQITLPKQFDQQQQVQSYGAQMTIPQQAQMIAPKQIQSYGAQFTLPKQLEQQQQTQSYGNQWSAPQQAQMIIPKQLEQQQQTQSYGNQWSAPQQAQMIIPKQFEQQQPVQSYGAQITIPQQAQMIIPKQFEQQQPVQSYGAQITIPQQAQMIAPKEVQPYGTQLNMQKQLDQQQPAQSYGGQFTLPKQQQSQQVQSYGAQFTLPQNFQTLTAQVPQKQQQDDFVSVKQSSGY